MARVLAATVHLVDEDGVATVYPAGSTPPANVAEKITNESAWAEEDAEKAVGWPAPAPPQDNSTPPPPPPSDDPPAGDEPARNASTEAWKTYAEGLGQAVEPDAKRDAIIAQLASAGLIKD